MKGEGPVVEALKVRVPPEGSLRTLLNSSTSTLNAPASSLSGSLGRCQVPSDRADMSRPQFCESFTYLTAGLRMLNPLQSMQVTSYAGT